MSRAADQAPRPVVVAVRHATFVRWCRDNKISPRRAIWIGTTEHVNGMRGGDEGLTFIASDGQDTLRLQELVELLRARGVYIRPPAQEGSEPFSGGGEPVI